MLKNKRIAILGSSGQLGSWLHQQLYPLCQVFCGNPGETYVDINDSDLFNNCMDVFKPDIIINCAAYTKVDAAEEACSSPLNTPTPYYTNTFSVGTIAKWCNENNAKLVHISTDYVFGDMSKRHADSEFSGWTEQDKPVPSSVYAQSKYMGEHEALQCKKALVIRTSGLYGHANTLKQTSFVQAMLNRQEDRVHVVRDQIVSPTYSKHLADAIICLLTKHPYINNSGEHNRIFHIANTGSISWYDFAKMIFRIAGDVLGIKKQVIPISTHYYIAMQASHVVVAKRPSNSSLNCSLFNRITDCKMPAIEEALTEYILFLKKKQDES